MLGIGSGYFGPWDEGLGRLVSEHKQNTKPQSLIHRTKTINGFHPPLSITIQSRCSNGWRPTLLAITLKTTFTITNSQSSVIVFVEYIYTYTYIYIHICIYIYKCV